jgi:hypothetical protein
VFEYLSKFVNPSNDNERELVNWFFPLAPGELEKAESKFGFEFPFELKTFYKEVGGYGSLKVSNRNSKESTFYGSNTILPPSVIMEIFEDEGSDYMSKSTYELLQPGDLPVFEIADSSSFMFMKPQSDAPNAVWFMGVEKIEDSFSKFIWRLYHEDPDYFSQGWGSDYKYE